MNDFPCRKLENCKSLWALLNCAPVQHQNILSVKKEGQQPPWLSPNKQNQRKHVLEELGEDASQRAEDRDTQGM